jgi:tetratricopeptide (TPR) repeat protein
MTSTSAAPDRRSRLLARAGASLAILIMLAVGLFLALKLSRDREIAKDVGRARHLVALGRFDEAKVPLKRWLEARPDSAEAVFLAARAAISLGLAEQGLQGLERSRSLGYDPRQVDREIALTLAGLGRHAEAEPTLRKLSAQAPATDAQIEETLARGYMATFQLRAATDAIERWLKADPDNPLPYLWRAEVGLRTNATADQLHADYERALTLDAESKEARLGLAGQKLDRREYDVARTLYEQVLAKFPDDPEAVRGLGRALDGLGLADEAEQQLKRAATLDPRSIQPLLDLARAAMRRGQADQALAVLDQALAIDDSEPELHYQRSLALARLDRHAEAEAERQRTAQLRAEHAEIGKILSDLHAHPDDVQRKLDAARWLFSHNHPEEAIRWALVILADDPRQREANMLMADYYDQRGDTGLANFYRLRLADPQPRSSKPGNP